MRRAVLAGVVGVLVAGLVTIGLAVAGASDEPGGPVGDRIAAPADAPVARRALAGLSGPGTVVATGDGIVVEAITSATPATPATPGSAATDTLRITLAHGPFAVRDLPIVVRADGRVVGRARPSPDLSAATAVSFDRTWVHVGAEVTWSYGDTGPQAVAGTIAAVQG